MPLNASFVNSIGHLPNEIDSKLGPFIRLIDKHVAEVQREWRLPQSQVRLLRPCNVLYLVNGQNMFVVLTNINAGGVVRHIKIDWRDKLPMDLSTAIDLAERDVAFEQAFGFSFPLKYLDATDEQFKQNSEEVAKSYMEEELAYIDKTNRIVRINPMFNGREFLLDSSLVFILSPFSEPFDAIYNDHVKPVVEGLNLRCNRADNIYDNRPIIEDIWKSINEAKIIIAELTGKNPNVFYETGIAHTVGKEVILLTQSIDDVPFDLRHLRCIVYDYTPPGVKTLETNLKNTIETILKR